MKDKAMNVDEVRAAKTKLENHIASAVADFAFQTGLNVTGIHLVADYVRHYGDREKATIYNVKVAAEV